MKKGQEVSRGSNSGAGQIASSSGSVATASSAPGRPSSPSAPSAEKAAPASAETSAACQSGRLLRVSRPWAR